MGLYSGIYADEDKMNDEEREKFAFLVSIENSKKELPKHGVITKMFHWAFGWMVAGPVIKDRTIMSLTDQEVNKLVHLATGFKDFSVTRCGVGQAGIAIDFQELKGNEWGLSLFEEDIEIELVEFVNGFVKYHVILQEKAIREYLDEIGINF